MLIVIGGPMFSGKTTWLLEYEKTLPKGTYLLFKPNIDTRYAVHEFVSHDGQRLPAHNLSVTNPKFPKLSPKITTLLIDEINFFDEKIIPILLEQKKKGKTVIAAGLFYDFANNVFGPTLKLSQKADKTIELFATCDRCGKKASQSYRKVNSVKQFLLGGSETYGACCKRCWNILSRTQPE